MSTHLNVFLKQVAINLRAIRVERNLLQKEVREQTHIHIGRIESGQANIKLSTLQTLCDYYQISLPTLFEGIS